MPPRSKTKKTPLPNKSAKTLPPSKSAKAPRKDTPVGNQNPVIGTKRKGPNSKTPSKPKQAKETSNSEVRLLTTADILNFEFPHVLTLAHISLKFAYTEPPKLSL